jgi:hypothetical protein
MPMRTARLALPLLVGLCSCDGCGPTERDLWVVNNSGTPFSVVVDGKEVHPTIASDTAVGPSPGVRVKVKPGDHTIEARFTDGTKAVRRVMFSQQTSGYVFAPRRSKTLCFYATRPDGETALDLTDEVLGLPHVLDEEHKLEMKPCGR